MMWVRMASILMFLAVALGAFGSHALRGKISEYSLDVYKTAVLYHFVHALGLFVVAWLWLSTITPDPLISWAGWLMLAGTVLFSGSLYFLAIKGIKWLGAITPIGGLCFLASWLLLVFVKFGA